MSLKQPSRILNQRLQEDGIELSKQLSVFDEFAASNGSRVFFDVDIHLRRESRGVVNRVAVEPVNGGSQ